jgi:hypothetical protein
VNKIEVAGGAPLRRTGVDDDGRRVSSTMEGQAHVVGLIRFLEEVARRDENPQYRRSARIHADILKGTYNPERAAFEAETGLVLEAQPTQIDSKPLAIGVVDVETKEVK